jgi:hypothetical protein
MTELFGATSLVNSSNILLQSAASTPEVKTTISSEELDSLSLELREVKQKQLLNNLQKDQKLDSLSLELGEVKQLLNNLHQDLKQTNNAPVPIPEPTQQAKTTTHQSFLLEESIKCIPWSRSDSDNHTMQPFDYWMLHNPHWFVTNETDDELCIARGDLQDDLVKDFLMMYATQFYSGCAKVNWRFHWLSGWG